VPHSVVVNRLKTNVLRFSSTSNLSPYLASHSTFVIYSRLAFRILPGLDRRNTFMARQASNKPDSGSPSSFTLGFEGTDLRWKWSGATWTTKGCPQGERGGVHPFGVLPNGNANFAWVQHFMN
jgi:hypothetical protein